MIRRAAYQEVVVVFHAADHPTLPLPPALSPTPSSFSAPPVYTQHTQQTQPQTQQQQQYPLSTVRPWDNTFTSTEHNFNESNTFKVPIHLIKRSRAVLFKDLECLTAPSSTAGCGSSGRFVQAIRTQRGDIIYSRHGHDPDDHESSNNNIPVNNQNFTESKNNNCSNSNINKHYNSIAADGVDAAAGATRSSHRPSDSSLPASVALPYSSSFSSTNNTMTPTSTTSPSASSSSSSTSISYKPQLQQPTFIPVHEDMEDCIWYLYPSSSPSLTSSSSRSSSANNHPFTTTMTATPITNGKDEHRLVRLPDTTNCSQPCSSSSSFTSASASSPFSVVENSKKELFSLLDTSMASTTAAVASPILQGVDQATLLQCRRRQEQQEEWQETHRQERGGGGGGLRMSTITAMQGFDNEEGCCPTLFQGLSHAGPPDDADKEGHAADGVEKGGGRGGEVDESQTRTTILGGGISVGQSSLLTRSRSRSEKGSTTQTTSLSSSMSTRTSDCQTLFVTTPNINGQGQQRLEQEEEEEEQRRLYDKVESNDTPSHSFTDNHRFEQTTFAPRPSSLDDSSLSLSHSSLPTSSFVPFSSPSSLSCSSCTPASAYPPHPLPASSSSTQLPLTLSSRSAPTLSTPTQTTNSFNQTNSTDTAFTSTISGSDTSNSKITTMTPPTIAHTHTHAHSQESSHQRQHRPAAVVACTVECWTAMIQLQEQLERLAQSVVSVLDSGCERSSLRLGGVEEEVVGGRRTSELRAMAMAALETCAGISSSSSSSSSTITATTMTTLTPRSSQHDTKDTTDHDDDSISGDDTSHGLLTPEATPVSTPVIAAAIYHHHQQQPATPRGSLHSVSSVSSSKTFTCSSGGGGSGSGMVTSLSALTLPGTIVSDLEQQGQRQPQERNNTRDDGDNDSNDPQLLQDTVSHFSSYRMSFPPPLPNSSTPSSSSTAANPLNNTSTSTSTATPPATRTVSASQTMPPFTTATATPTTTTMRPSSGKKSRNPFLTMFGRTSSSTTSSLSPSSLPLQGPISLGGVTQVNSQHPPSPKAHKNSSGGSSNGSRYGRKKEDKKSGDEGTGGGEKKKRRSSWFKSATATTAAAATTTAATTTIQRGRANTMLGALPSSSSSGSHLNNHRGSPPSSSSANTATITASGPESSASRATAAAAPGGTLTAKRFSPPFQFNLRGPGSRRSTLPTVNSTNTSTSRAPPPPLSSSPSSSSSCQNSPSIASFPRHLHAQPVGSQSRPQYYYYSAPAAAGNPQQYGPSTMTATGSFFDSVSDDDSDSDSDEGFPSQYQQRQQYQHQLQQAPPPHYYQQQHVQPQQQQSAAVVSSRQHEQDRRYQSYDSDEDSDSSEEEEDSEDDSVEDSDEEDLDVDDEEETNSSYRHHDQQQVVNADTLEGYMHEFDDTPPPPSYHSLIRAEADAARSAALATLSARGRQSQQQHTHSHAHIHAHAHSSPTTYPHTSTMMPSTLLTGLSSSSSSSSIITPTAQASTPPASSSPQASPTVLANLLTLLHTFESHLLTHHKTPSFQAKQPTAATMSRRQAWLDRNPQTIASFAYLLIELQQTGILPTAMSPSWFSTSPSSSPSSPGSPLSASMALDMSEQDWLSMTGNAATEADLAKALLALEQSCLLAMDPVLWHREGEVRRDAWIRQVQAIITSSSN